MNQSSSIPRTADAIPEDRTNSGRYDMSGVNLLRTQNPGRRMFSSAPEVPTAQEVERYTKNNNELQKSESLKQILGDFPAPIMMYQKPTQNVINQHYASDGNTSPVHSEGGMSWGQASTQSAPAKPEPKKGLVMFFCFSLCVFVSQFRNTEWFFVVCLCVIVCV